MQINSVEGMVNEGELRIKLNPPVELLEAGEISIRVILQDSNGVESTQTATLPLILNAPRIVTMIPCNEDGAIMS